MVKLEKKVKENVEVAVISGIILLFVFFVLYHISYLYNELTRLFSVLMPFILGFAVSFVLWPIVRIFENHFPFKVDDKIKRKWSLFFAFFVMSIVIFILLMMLIPSLLDSIRQLIILMNSVVSNIDDIMLYITSEFGLSDVYMSQVFEQFENIFSTFVDYMTKILPDIITSSFNLVSNVFSVILGIVIGIYIILDRERFYTQIKKVMYAIFPKKRCDWIIEVSTLSSYLFKRFIIGKSIDSLIIGLLCFVGMSLFAMPYALLISTIIGVTNMIPVFGPFIGAIPGVFIIMIIDPIQSLWFILFVVVLQQFDGNILGPYILGDSMGLPSFWIMFAIVVGGGFFGLVGMFLGVPLFALIYYLVKIAVNHSLEEKGIEIE